MDPETETATKTVHANMAEIKITPSQKTEPNFEPVMKKLVEWLENDGGEGHMEELHVAVDNALKYNIKELNVLQIDDAQSFLVYMNKMLKWVPRETFDGKDIYYHIFMFYFVLNQPPMRKYQTAIRPKNVGQMSWLSRWLVEYAAEIGKFCDHPDSISKQSINTFRKTPSYKMSNYIEPRGGWATFNQFFARHVKPGYRTIYGLNDPTVVVSPADSTFGGSWNVDLSSYVYLKHVQWSIHDLLQGSRFAGEFHGGAFTHSFLNTFDYHRLHTPVAGKVLESRVIQGQAYMETRVVYETDSSADGTLVSSRSPDTPETPGYQFVQMRGLTVIDSPIGLVAVLPIGMATASSIIMTAEEGVSLRKGEEIGYFQFGGSDIVMVFQARSKVAFTAIDGTHLCMGMPVATAKVQP